MHEYSIVGALIEQCEKHAAEHRAKGISRVAIKVGVLSGIEPALLQTAFDTFKQAGICRHARLEMQVQPLVVFCRLCGQQSTLAERQVICPQCGSRDTQVIDGEEMLLMQLELET